MTINNTEIRHFRKLHRSVMNKKSVKPVTKYPPTSIPFSLLPPPLFLTLRKPLVQSPDPTHLTDR